MFKKRTLSIAGPEHGTAALGMLLRTPNKKTRPIDISKTMHDGSKKYLTKAALHTISGEFDKGSSQADKQSSIARSRSTRASQLPSIYSN
jgi:hypothetical protein